MWREDGKTLTSTSLPKLRPGHPRSVFDVRSLIASEVSAPERDPAADEIPGRTQEGKYTTLVKDWAAILPHVDLEVLSELGPWSSMTNRGKNCLWLLLSIDLKVPVVSSRPPKVEGTGNRSLTCTTVTCPNCNIVPMRVRSYIADIPWTVDSSCPYSDLRQVNVFMAVDIFKYLMSWIWAPVYL